MKKFMQPVFDEMTSLLGMKERTKQILENRYRKQIDKIRYAPPKQYEMFLKIINYSISDISSLSTKVALKNLKIIRSFYENNYSISLSSKGATSLWNLIKRIFQDKLTQNSAILDFSELTNLDLLKDPEVIDRIKEWKKYGMNTLLVRLKKIFSSGNEAKGQGGTKKKWPYNKEVELFARVHLEKLKNKKLSTRSASIKVAKEMDEVAKTVETKYGIFLENLLKVLTNEKINEAVKLSFK